MYKAGEDVLKLVWQSRGVIMSICEVTGVLEMRNFDLGFVDEWGE